MAVEVHVNGNGNGHHDALGPTEELVLGNGHHADGNGNGHHSLPSTGNGTNGNGHHEEPAEGQQSLFSWAEFLAEEPAPSRGRNGKAKPAAASLFQWALDQEQEREKEPVGAGPLDRNGTREGPPLISGGPSRISQPKFNRHKGVESWHASLSMTTASSPTRTPK